MTNRIRVSIRGHGQVSYVNSATIEKHTINYKYAASHSYHTSPTYGCYKYRITKAQVHISTLGIHMCKYTVTLQSDNSDNNGII